MYKLKPIEKFITVESLNSALNHKHHPGFVFAGEMHDFWEAVFVESGKAVASADEQIFNMHTGQILFHKPMQFHRIKTDGQMPVHLRIISFTASGKGMKDFERKYFDLSSSEIKEYLNVFNLIGEACDNYEDGIKKDMGVISANGIVGKIANVSDNYASVISMLHPYSVVSARFTENQHLANVSWETTDYRFGTVKDIPLHLFPQKGDTLVTSGFSNIYPADIMIGTIEEMLDNNSKDFNTAKIRFSTNFSTLRHVYVIENLHQTEIDFLISNK